MHSNDCNGRLWNDTKQVGAGNEDRKPLALSGKYSQQWAQMCFSKALFTNTCGGLDLATGYSFL